MKFPNCNFSIKQIEDLICFITHDLRQSYVYFFTQSRYLIDGSFRLYMMDKTDLLQIPIYMFVSENQKLHSQNCLMREFSLNHKYFMNGLKPTTVPTFLDHSSSVGETYIHRYIADDVVSVEFASNYQFTFPFETAHCHSVGKDILSTPISDNDEMINIIKITNRLKRLQPQILVSSIYYCILSSYHEEDDSSPQCERPFF